MYISIKKQFLISRDCIDTLSRLCQGRVRRRFLHFFPTIL